MGFAALNPSYKAATSRRIVMKRSTSIVLAGLGASALVVVGAIAAIEWFMVHPYKVAVDTILVQVDNKDKSPPLLIRRVVRMWYPTHDKLADVVATLLWFRLVGPTWHSASRMGLPDLEIGLVCRRMNDEQLTALFDGLAHSHGLNALSHELYAKPLDQLTREQLAAVMVVEKYPSSARHPERIGKRQQYLLSQLAAVEQRSGTSSR
jgi:hypothetical protein